MARKRLVLSAGLLSLACVVGVVIAILTGAFYKSPIPNTIRKQIPFSVYYPKTLPLQLGLQPSSVAYTDAVFFYTLTNGKQSVVVSQQKTPETFDFATFEEKSLKNRRESTTSSGDSVHIGTLEHKNIASVRTPSTWVLLTADEQVTLKDLETIARSLHQ